MSKLSQIGSETIPKVKASLPEIGKFVLLALGWILGRIIHVEIDKLYPGKVIFEINALLDSTKKYVLTGSDIIALIALAAIAWILYKWGKMLKWLGAGLFLYIVTFEVYELFWGYVLTSVTPLPEEEEGQ